MWLFKINPKLLWTPLLGVLTSTVLAAPSKNIPIPTPRPERPALVTKAKTNICSITINSSDEIETFKKNIGDKNANYIELTTLTDEVDLEAPSDESDEGSPGDTSVSSWLAKACKQKIKCDVLVISGHFAGTFFGSSGLSLSMEQLEQASCDASCDGVIQNPKEVYLFGCNTLAGKTKDHRSPEEYRRVLREDGFSAEQAEQVVAFRYSPIGDAFSDRMRRVFRGAPRIYGFDSVGPSGRNVKGLLQNYFRSIKGKNYYLPENLNKLNESVNGELARALKVTAFTQDSGAKEMSREQIPVCYLNNPKVPFYHKLNWISSTLRSEKSFSYLPTINDWLTRLSVENYQWKDKEFEVLERVMGHHELRDSLRAIVARRDSAILGMQLKILTFMKFFGWIYEKEYVAKIESLLIGDLKVDFDLERKDQICSYAIANELKVDFPPSQVPDARWSDPEFVQALQCSASFNEDLMEKMLISYLAAPPNSQLQLSYRTALQNMKIPEIAAPRYFRALFPNGDQGLDESRKLLLCQTNTYQAKHPLMPVEALNPRLARNTSYIQNIGCYLQFNRGIYSHLFEWGRTGDAARAAVIESLNLQRSHTDDFQIDEKSQAEMMDLMENASTTERRTLAEVWAQVKNITPSVQSRMKSSLSAHAALPLSETSATLENLVSTTLPADVYCPFSVDRAEAAYRAGQWTTLFNILDSLSSRCARELADGQSPDYPRAEKPRVRMLFSGLLSLMGKESEKTIADHIELFGPMPIDLVGQIIEFKTRLRDLNDARVLSHLNRHTYQGRMGYVSNDAQIMELYPKDRLAPDVLAAMSSSKAEVRALADLALGAIDIQDDSILPKLTTAALSKGFQNDPALELRALGRQDTEKATWVWLQILEKQKVASDFAPGFPKLFAYEDSPLFPILRSGLKSKSLKESLVARALKIYSQQFNTDFEFDKVKIQIRAFAQEFPTPVIQAAARDSLRIIQARENECEESPRACVFISED